MLGAQGRVVRLNQKVAPGQCAVVHDPAAVVVGVCCDKAERVARYRAACGLVHVVVMVILLWMMFNETFIRMLRFVTVSSV